MSLPTEQLVRDYLNRLSVAARGQLGPDDRRALVNRTRDFIERKAGLAEPPTAMEVARLLSGLGDPSALVQQERQRLAAVRGDMPEPAAHRNPIRRVLRRDSGKQRGPSWHWPAVAGHRTDLQITLLDSGSGVTGSGVTGSGVTGSGVTGSGVTGRGGSNGTGAGGGQGDDGLAPVAESAPLVSAQPGDPDWFFQVLSGESEAAHDPAEPSAISPSDGHVGEPVPGGRARPPWPPAGVGGAASRTGGADDETAQSDVPAPTIANPAWQLTMPPDPVFPRARQALTAVASWYRQRPLEASAVVLLGLGGAIYPPVWLLGAVVALASRVWDGRDKWLGLAAPLLLTVIAVALGVASGGRISVGYGVHEGWVFGVIGSRVAAVLSATYLGWRSVHGRRPPAVPPWNRPHKVS